MTPAELLREALDHWGDEIANDLEVSGADLVEWFFGTFVPKASEAIGWTPPEPERDDEPDYDALGDHNHMMQLRLQETRGRR
jgi:hypothetical protein